MTHLVNDKRYYLILVFLTDELPEISLKNILLLYNTCWIVLKINYKHHSTLLTAQWVDYDTM